MKNKPGIVTNFVPHQNGSKIPHITFQTREINYSKFYKKKIHNIGQITHSDVHVHVLISWGNPDVLV